MGFPIQLGVTKMGVLYGKRAEKWRGSSSSGGPDFGEWRTLRSGPSCAMDHHGRIQDAPKKLLPTAFRAEG